MKASRIVSAIGVAIALLTSPAAYAGFLGSTIHADARYPTSGDVVINYGNALVGAGIEFGATSNTNQLAFDIGDSTIRIFSQVGLTVVPFAAATFNGFGFDDALSTIDSIVGVSIDASTTLSGFTAGRLSFTGDQVLVNLESLQFLGDQQLLLNIQFANGVPEPTTLALLGLGLAGLAATRRRKR